MNRRELLKTSAGSPFLLMGLTGCQTETNNASQKHVKADSNKITLSGLTLQKLHNRYKHDLFEDFLPFFDEHVIDHQYGGFMCNTDRSGKNLDTNKNAWYAGRGIWVYSFLYNHFGKNPEYLEVARKAKDFVLSSPPKANELWPAEYTRQGKPIPAKGQYIGNEFVTVSKQVYGDLFIAEGLVEYAKATGQEEYWDMSKKILFKCVHIYDQPDYAPQAPLVYLPGQDAPPLPGPRILGVWMLLTHLTRQMLEQKDDPEVKRVADRAINAIFEYHYNAEYDLLNEILMHDMSRPDNEYRDLVYTGHGIETMWMVMYEAHRRQDKCLFDKAARMFKRSLEVAWDDVYGGFFRGLKEVNKNDWILDKALWVQEEALIGLLFIVEQTNEQWAKDWFVKVYTLVQEKYPLKKHGYALWDLWPDRQFTFIEKAKRVGNYHHPRHIMLNLLTIERIMERNS